MVKKATLIAAAGAVVLGPVVLENIPAAYGHVLKFLKSPDIVSRTITLIIATTLIFSTLVSAEWLRRKALARLASRGKHRRVDAVGVAVGVFLSMALFFLALLTSLDAVTLAGLAIRHPLSIETMRCVSLTVLVGLLVLAQAAAILIYGEWFDGWQNRLDRFIAEHPRQFHRLMTQAAAIGSGALLILSVFPN